MELDLKVRAELLAERARLEEENLMIREKMDRLVRANAESYKKIEAWEEELRELEVLEVLLKDC